MSKPRPVSVGVGTSTQSARDAIGAASNTHTTHAMGMHLGIVCIGDSHTEGHLDTVTVSGAEKLGLFALSSPRDLEWTGTADRAWCGADNTIGTDVGCQDPNAAHSTSRPGSFTAWIPQLLRRAFPVALGTIRIANLGIGGSSTYSWVGVQANGFFQCPTTPPVAGDTVTLGGVTYTFRASATLPNEVTISSTAGTMQNLGNAINAEGTGWGAGTVPNPNCFCPNVSSSINLHVYAILTGPAGNSIGISSSTANVLSLDNALSPTTHLVAGATGATLYNANKALIPASFGSVDIITITLGTNDAARTGYRARGMQTELAALVAKLHVDFPAAKIIIWRAPIGSGVTNTTITSTVLPAVDAVVAANPGFVYSVDMNSVGAGLNDVLTLGSDPHLSQYGYSVAAQLFAKGIANALGLV